MFVLKVGFGEDSLLSSLSRTPLDGGGSGPFSGSVILTRGSDFDV